ncbi:hypothetical protein [Microbacterium invictum]|uniref:Uncharacterized protein n=1 Tax=Microbacterium invictum TaxID=515415 RepID=A0AA40SNU2_9MICO|nr:MULTISPECIES: hypothetical protein [Microbacterium]MBB4139663.1 hypothetical protein [Microbacterium invictum]
MDHNPTADRVPSGDGGENTFDDPGGNLPDAGENKDVTPADAAAAEAASPTDPAAVDPAAGALGADGAPAPGHGGDHHGQDRGRTTATVSEAQHAMRGAKEQDLPAMAQNNAVTAEKLAGIIAQTRADLPGAKAESIAYTLRERAAQAGLHLDDDVAAELAGEIAAGD